MKTVRDAFRAKDLYVLKQDPCSCTLWPWQGISVRIRSETLHVKTGLPGAWMPEITRDLNVSEQL